MKKTLIIGFSIFALLMLFSLPVFSGGGLDDGPPSNDEELAEFGTASSFEVFLKKPAANVLNSNCETEIYNAIDNEDYDNLFTDPAFNTVSGRDYFMYITVRDIDENIVDFCLGTCFERDMGNNNPVGTFAMMCDVLTTGTANASFLTLGGILVSDLMAPTNAKYNVTVQVCSGCRDCEDSNNNAGDILWWEQSRDFQSLGELINAEFQLEFQGAINCSSTLDCTNWPS